MFGDNVSLMQGLVLTVVAMTIVFLVLLILSWAIDLMRFGLRRFTTVDPGGILTGVGDDSNKYANFVVLPHSKHGNVKNLEGNGIDPELVAVISAALAVAIGRPGSAIRVKSIKRVPQKTPVWSMASRQEQVYSRLTRH
ncbi:MAG TPA: OadG family protein [Clostridia bacterium]|nr:OadG family protein [Clostridia bacterium]